MRAYLDAHKYETPRLYIERGGLFNVYDEIQGFAGSQFQLPASADELRPETDVVDEIDEALSKALIDVKTTKAVRRVIGEVLREHGVEDVEWWMS
jgi:hypothetical protein